MLTLYNPEDMKFEELRVHYPLLYGFIDFHPFQINKDGDEIKIKLADNKLFFTVLDGFNVSIESNTRLETDMLTRMFKLKGKFFAYISPHSGDPVDYRDYKDFLIKFENILSFITEKPFYASCIQGKSSDGEWNNIGTHVTPGKVMSSGPESFRIKFSDIKSEFHDILSNAIDSSFQHVLGFYVDHLYNTRKSLEEEFLSYVNGLEAYHKIYFNSEVSLKTRLKELKDYSDMNITPRELDRIVKIRNYLSHGRIEHDHNELNYLQTDFELPYKIRTFLKRCLLKKLDFRNDEIEALWSI
ncbi:MAG: hypothetical protein QFX30_03610 [Methanothermobacter sp.]|nr:hypothetical protein [Methanothermobacter sp.]MDI9618146.1 hypothetical protein [Methanothermobacter sp.]